MDITKYFENLVKAERRIRVQAEQETEEEEEDDDTEIDAMLSHAAGRGVVDTGCGRSLIGKETLVKHHEMLEHLGYTVTNLENKNVTFRNGSQDKSIGRVVLLCFLGGNRLRLRPHMVPGKIPLLVSKFFLMSLGARLDLEEDRPELRKIETTVPMIRAPAEAHTRLTC